MKATNNTLHKRDGVEFVDGNGTDCMPANTTVATMFQFNSGNLLLDGQCASVPAAGVLYSQFPPPHTDGADCITFSVDSQGMLLWIDSQFGGGKAYFCLQANGEVDALYAGPSDAGYPPSCSSLALALSKYLQRIGGGGQTF